MLAESYHLKSDLARVCLPYPQGHPQRTLAWVNSICFLFLFVALSGARPGLPAPKPVPPLEEPVPIIIQPLPQTPPPQAEQPNKEESTEDKAPAPRVVVVTPDSPAISFSVPTIGNVLVPNAIAQAPPAAPPKAPAVVHNIAENHWQHGRGRRPPPAALPGNGPQIRRAGHRRAIVDRR